MAYPAMGQRSVVYRILDRGKSAPGVILAHLRGYKAPWIAALVVAIALAIGLEAGLERLIHRWYFAYSHSWLLFPMSAWLLAVALRQGNITHLGPSVLGLFAVAVSIIFYGLSELLDFTTGMQLGVFLVFAAALWALLGIQFAWHASGAFALLTFTLPAWDLINGVLQDISTWVVGAWLRATGIVAHFDMYYITIPSGTFEIAEGCSGLRYVLVGLALGVFYGFCWLRLWKYRVALLVVAGIASMAANWVRIYVLIVIGDWTQMEHYLIQVSHDEYGWVVFFIVMAPVLWFARTLERREAAQPQRVATSGAHGIPNISGNGAFLLAGTVVVALLLSPLALRSGHEPPAEPQSVTLIETTSSGWSSTEASHRWNPDYESPDIEARAAFSRDEGRRVVDVYVARYLNQQPQSKLIATRNSLSPEWRVVRTDTASINVNGDERRLRQQRLQSGGDSRLQWNWYLVGGRPSHSEPLAKILEIPALMSGRRDGAVIALSASCAEHDCAEAADVMRSFLDEHGARLEAIGRGESGVAR